MWPVTEECHKDALHESWLRRRITHLVFVSPQMAAEAERIKASSYIVQYPVLRTAQSALHFISLTDLFTQTPSRLLWEASSQIKACVNITNY